MSRRSGAPAPKQVLSSGQRALLQAKVHLAPPGPAVAAGARSAQWRDAVDLVQALAGLPDPALTWWAAQPTGHMLLAGVGAGGGDYHEGPLQVGSRQLWATARIVWDREAAQRSLLPAFLLLDHLLGTRARQEGGYLSAGVGLTPAWQEVGRQLAALFRLGYGLSAAGCADGRVYLAEGLVAALHERRRLNVADPKLDRLLQATLLNEGFWVNHLPGPEMESDTGSGA